MIPACTFSTRGGFLALKITLRLVKRLGCRDQRLQLFVGGERSGLGYPVPEPSHTRAGGLAQLDLAAGASGQGRGYSSPSKSPCQTCCWSRQANDTPSTGGLQYPSHHSLTSRVLHAHNRYYFSESIFLLRGVLGYFQPCAGVTLQGLEQGWLGCFGQWG